MIFGNKLILHKQELWQVWRAFCLYGYFQIYIDKKRNIFDKYENIDIFQNIEQENPRNELSEIVGNEELKFLKIYW